MSIAALQGGPVVLWLVSVIVAVVLDAVAAMRVCRAGPERFRFGRWSEVLFHREVLG